MELKRGLPYPIISPLKSKLIMQQLALVALVVNDYDEAIEYYTQVWGFTLTEDTQLTETKRWVVVAPQASNECKLLLAKAANDEQKSRVGNQTGGRVFLFLHTDNFKNQFERLVSKQVKLVRGPSEEPYGTVAVFSDMYGNLWDLIEPIRI